MIKIGIIGTGFGAKVHIPGFQKIAGVKVWGLAGRDQTTTERLAKAWQIPKIYKNWQAMVNDPAIDAVSIVTPPYLHYRIARAALLCKKAVFVEKAFVMSPKEATSLFRLAKKNKVIHGVDFEFRNIPYFQLLKALLEKKTIGKIRLVKIDWLTGGRAKNDLPPTWHNYKRYGGGTLFNYGSHVIDYVEWLFGQTRSVQGTLLQLKNFRTKGVRPDAEDTCLFSLRLTNNIRVEVTISNVLFGGRGHHLEIYGDQGTLRLSNPDVRDAVKGFQLFRTEAINEITKTIALPKSFHYHPRPEEDGRLFPFRLTAQEFIAALSGKKKNRPTFKDGLRVQNVMAAITKSDREQKWISV